MKSSLEDAFVRWIIVWEVKMIRQKLLLLLTCVLISSSVWAQERYTENTLKLSSGKEPPAAKIEDVNWLAGTWTGEAMGGFSEEIWSLPKGGAMVGVYRFVKKEKVVFYELMTIVEERGSLVLRLKHFNPSLAGWEEKDKTIDFQLVSKTAKAIYFEGMTYKLEGDNAVAIFLAAKKKDGTISEEKFVHRRILTTK
jgi:hypothetical protein